MSGYELVMGFVILAVLIAVYTFITEDEKH